MNVGNTGRRLEPVQRPQHGLALLAVATLIAILCLAAPARSPRLGPCRSASACFAAASSATCSTGSVHGHVIDFLDFHFGSYIYPTFNVADSGICVGVAIYLLYSLCQPDPPNKP